MDGHSHLFDHSQCRLPRPIHLSLRSTIANSPWQRRFGTGKPLAVDFDSLTKLKYSYATTAALTLPTFAFCFVTKRMHTVAGRQLNTRGNLETCVWQARMP